LELNEFRQRFVILTHSYSNHVRNLGAVVAMVDSPQIHLACWHRTKYKSITIIILWSKASYSHHDTAKITHFALNNLPIHSPWS
jgi:hypothetical protein